MALEIEIFGRTDVGRTREDNQDSFLCLDLSVGALARRSFPWLLAVADGIGGHTGGAQASDLAVRTLEQDIRAGLDGPESAGPQSLLEQAFQRANRLIFEAASKLPNAAGMGTTLVAALAGTSSAFVSNVGDSRAYLVRKGRLYPITQDHSWAAEQRKLNVLTPEEIERSPFRTLVTRSLGYENDVKIDTFQIELRPGDDLFLCSDGLYGRVPEKAMGRVFRKTGRIEDICSRLIEAANENGGPDNITAVVGRVGDSGGRPRRFLSGTILMKPPAPNQG
jgi:serine/threonine protein phosphatase PrpC